VAIRNKKSKIVMAGIDKFKNTLKKAINKSGGDALNIKGLLPKDLRNSYDMEEKKKEEEVDEATTSASAGAFMAPLGADPRFKKKTKQEEVDEATGASSSGSYVTPQMWAKNPKNWKGAAKTQFPGGKFVKIKDKCKTFPYCNQGDINALDLTENKMVKQAINEVSKKTGKDKDYLKKIVKKEMEEIIRRNIYKSPITSILGPETKMDKPIGKIYSMGSNVGGKYE
jgi:hypothetical protein|tara:strand:+ start:1038 stop:1715 length:678 start_codon:yes stop_codon:yes gene_type:complete